MNPFPAFFSAVALLPAMAGPLPTLVRDGAIIVELCNGGTVAIPLGNNGPPSGDVPCCAKGCRSGEKRKRFDSRQ